MADPVKTIPSSFGRKNLLRLLLPTKGYQYFQQSGRYGFKHDANTHSHVNAWWLAEFSLLAYENADPVRAVLNSVEGLEINRFAWFESSAQEGGTGTQGFGLDAGDFAVVCFRGTEFYHPTDIRRLPARLIQMASDIYLDAKALPAEQVDQAPIFNVPIHTGFYRALSSVWDGLSRFIDGLDGKPIWVTGHSLGGAIATLVAYQFPAHVRGLYTYGSPCVGTAQFADKFAGLAVAEKTFRYVHGNDFVAKVLEVSGEQIGTPDYRHVGALEHVPAEARKNWLERLWNLAIALDQTDHAPLYYALHTWNRAPSL